MNRSLPMQLLAENCTGILQAKAAAEAKAAKAAAKAAADAAAGPKKEKAKEDEEELDPTAYFENRCAF